MIYRNRSQNEELSPVMEQSKIDFDTLVTPQADD